MEIKFRARNAELPRCWIYGYFVVENGFCYIINNDGKFKVIAGTEGLFTGFKDKNAKEIYEEDTVKIYTYIDEDEPELNEFTIHTVKWMIDEDYPAFDLEPFLDCECNGLSWAICDIESKGIEVIGKKFENTKLLKELK